MRKSLFLSLVLSFFFFTKGNSTATYPDNDTHKDNYTPTNTISVAEILCDDGTLDLSENISGTINMAGFQMKTLADGTPVFLEESSALILSDDQWCDTFGGGNGLNDWVRAIAVSGTDIYVGGNFTTAGGSPANRIAKWDGSTWSALGNGVDNSVYSIVVDGADLYVGGEFVTAGGVEVNSIAKWDGTNWSALGTGMIGGPVWSIAIDGNNIYAGGVFDTAGVVEVNNIAIWDGNDWDRLREGMNGAVYTLAVEGSNIYAGGAFTRAGGFFTNYVARWTGSDWAAMEGGVNGNVLALEVKGTDLYVGGDFTQADGSSANRIAKWDGTNWSTLGSGVNSWVVSIATFNDNIYVGGDFTQAGGSPANRIAKWNGTEWSAFGSGTNSYVYAMELVGTDIYTGGFFTTTGGMISNYIGKWNEGCSDFQIIDAAVLSESGVDNGDGSIDISYDGGLAPYSFIWSNGETTEDIIDLTNGAYTVTITDGNDCTTTGTFSLQTDLVIDGAFLDAILCHGENTGSIDVVMSGGTEPYSYQWSNGANTQDLEDLIAGTYFLTATDILGNIDTASFVINEPESSLEIVSSFIIYETLENTFNGSIELIIAGGVTPYLYSWSNGASTEDLVEINAGSYTITVTDAHGCSVTDTYIVNSGGGNSCDTDLNPPTPICQNIAFSLPPSGNQSINVNDIDGGSIDDCAIDTMYLDQTAFNCTNVGVNVINLTVTDEIGNSATCSAEVVISEVIAPVAISQNITIALDIFGDASISAADINNGSSDNCAIDTMYLNQTDFDCSHLDTNMVSFIVVDVAGNADTTTAIVVVTDPGEFCNIESGADCTNDITAPDAFCLNITVPLSDEGTATLDPIDVGVASSDDCSLAAFSLDVLDFDCDDLGVNMVTLTVTDDSGNTSTCVAEITIEDETPPIAICKDITIALDQDGETTITPDDINNGSTDNCGISAILLNQSNFDCGDIGQNIVTMTVIDDSNNVSTGQCTVQIIDILNACEEGEIEIAGVIETQEGLTVAGVDVTLSDGDNPNRLMTTTSNGLFDFQNLEDGEDYVVTPFKNTGHGNGVSTFDLVQMIQHILFPADQSPLTTPYQIIAADVNGDGKVTTVDVVRARQLVLFIITDFSPENTSWRFVPKNFVFPNPQDPFDTPIPQILNHPNISEDELNADFIAVKVGDVNNSVDPTNLVDDTDRTDRDPMYLMVDDVAMMKGETYTIDFKAKDFKDILGYQFTLEFDNDKMQYAGIESGALEVSEGNFGLQLLERGIITTSWNDIKAKSIEDETILFSMTFNALNDVNSKDVFDINSKFTKSESYRQDGEQMEVQLLFEEEFKFNSECDFCSCRPNPFTDHTSIGFKLPEASPGTMTFYTVDGKILKVIQGNFAKGYNEITITKEELHHQAGVIYYNLKTNLGSYTKKMILID